MKNTVLVIGAGGFLGQYILRQFAGLGWSVVAVDVALQAPAGLPRGVVYRALTVPQGDLSAVVREFDPGVCVHCAGSASVGLSLTDPLGDFTANTALVASVLDTLRREAPGCRFLLLSSAAVYGNPPSLPIAETTPASPISPYGFHKRMAEMLCEEYSRLFGLPTAIVRIFSAYGPGLKRQVLWDICRKIVMEKKLSLRGTGRESRDFIHASDIARALAIIATEGACTGEIYNLATGREVTIAEIAGQLTAALDADVSASFDGVESKGDPLNWRADTSRIAALGFSPAISLEDGLRDLAAWAAAELS